MVKGFIITSWNVLKDNCENKNNLIWVHTFILHVPLKLVYSQADNDNFTNKGALELNDYQ